MALIDCPECGTQVSSAAVSCPKCGYPIADSVSTGEGRFDEAAHESGVDLSEFEGPRPLPPLSEGKSKSELRKQTNKRDWRLLAAIVTLLLVAAAIFDRCGRGASEPPVVTVEPGSQSRGWVESGNRSAPTPKPRPGEPGSQSSRWGQGGPNASRGSTRAGKGLSPTPLDVPSAPKADEPGSTKGFVRWFDRLYTRDDHARACAKAVHGMAEYTKRFGEPGGLIQADMKLRGGDCYGYEHTNSFKCLVGTTMSAHVYDVETFRGLRLGFLRLDENALDTGCCRGVRKAAKEYPRAKFGQWEGGCNVRFGRVPAE